MQTKPHSIPFFYVVDSTWVPYGENPVIICEPLPYKEAIDALMSLKAKGDGAFYELIEA
jgi:hypothetical protein